MKSERNPRERTGMCNQLEARGQEPILRGKGSTVMMVISEAHIILDCPSSHASKYPSRCGLEKDTKENADSKVRE